MAKIWNDFEPYRDSISGGAPHNESTPRSAVVAVSPSVTNTTLAQGKSKDNTALQVPESKKQVSDSLPTYPATSPNTPDTASTNHLTSEVQQTQKDDGMVSITSTPDGADIFVDSTGRGKTPVLLRLSPGKHSVQIVNAGYKDWISTVEVKSGSIVNVTASLEK